jgi:peptidoglycan/LPS O-acetylase OafA/YrhL
MSDRQPVKGERWREIDGLRGLCALAVMLFHYVFRVQHIVPPADNPLVFAVPGLPDRLIGEIPVYVFFMISGFVISFTLDRSRTWRDFIVSRFSRLYPVYWVVTLLLAGVWTLFPPRESHMPLGVVLTNLTMLQDYVRVGSINPVYWSLTAELGFYALMLAVFLAGEFQRLPRWAAIWLILSIVFGIACAIFGEKNVPVPTVIAIFFNLFFAPYFVAGIVFYRVSREGWSAGRILLLAACVLGYFVMLPPVGATIMVAATLLWAAIVQRRARALTLRPLVFLGTISYALYLSHLVLGMHVIAALSGSPMIARVAAACAVSLALAIVLTFAVERPAQSFIRRIYRARTQPATVSP